MKECTTVQTQDDQFIIYTRIIKNILKNESVCRDIYIKTEKAQEQDGFGKQNEIPLPHNNPT